MKNTLYIFLLILIASACDKEETITDIVQFPRIKVVDTSFAENEAATISIGLTWAYTSPVSVKYELLEMENKSAEAGLDFVSAKGEVMFSPGDTVVQIDVDIIDDIVSEQDEKFRIQLSEPLYGELLNTEAILTIVNDDSEIVIDGSGYDAPSSYQGLERVWEDDFLGNDINSDYWTHETGNNGWGNNELQNYTDNAKNSFVSAGYLFIEAKEENFEGSNYTSARMKTEDKYEMKYGRIDIRAKLPEGKGIWPALWMLGGNFQEVDWPKCGEIDIMELIGSQPKIAHGTAHFGNSPGDKGSLTKSTFLSGGKKFSEEFHVFSMIWREDYLEWLVDGKSFHIIRPADLGEYAWPFNEEFFFIFNVAVGGDWPGSPNETTVFPQRMLVDYVRVYQ
ncbi:family 16 glycosylhydrolase [Portibacter lacus]|uniref:GH16 domain-containing protein n=1 Tax=Portibacter lacus TaxID=1099794 RepID=A0AA37SPM4_9BACT|nr:family 16 glycosylhydrolase [Portibacter lacus]GLR17635.1 hypothetical protein GCM10007940_22500 [Portibacter lacus]